MASERQAKFEEWKMAIAGVDRGIAVMLGVATPGVFTAIYVVCRAETKAR